MRGEFTLASVGEVGFGEAMRAQREALALKQEDVAVAMTDAGFKMSAQAVGNWERGESFPESPEKVFTLERVLHLPGGTLSRFLGYLPLDAVRIVGVEDALIADRTLSDDLREGMLAAYRSRRRKRR